MKVFKVTYKQKKGESYWDMKPLLVVAANFAAAEDKAKNFTGDDREIKDILVFGETTRKTDVFELEER